LRASLRRPKTENKSKVTSKFVHSRCAGQQTESQPHFDRGIVWIENRCCPLPVLDKARREATMGSSPTPPRKLMTLIAKLCCALDVEQERNAHQFGILRDRRLVVENPDLTIIREGVSWGVSAEPH